jgi:hypothetical protein
MKYFKDKQGNNISLPTESLHEYNMEDMYPLPVNDEGIPFNSYTFNGSEYTPDTTANKDAESEQSQTEENRKARAYLSSTDWMLLRELDGGTTMKVEVKELRAEARAKVIETKD